MKKFWGILSATSSLALVVGCSAPNQEIGSVATADAENSSGIIGGSVVVDADPVASSTVGIIDLRYGQVICTGSLIASNIVVTAGHCTQLNPQNIAIMFSTKIPKTQDEVSKIPVRRVVAGRTSPLWPKLNSEQEKDWGDIAILRFQGAVPAGYKPAKLLKSIASLKSGDSIILAGFGIIDGITKADTEALRKTEVSMLDPIFSNSEVLFDQSKGQGACHGDSGGPAFYKSGNQLFLFGVTSRGYKDDKDQCNRSAIYTNIVSYIPWIKTTITALNKMTKAEPMPQP